MATGVKTDPPNVVSPGMNHVTSTDPSSVVVRSQAEGYQVKMRIVRKVSVGDFKQAQITAEAVQRAGLDPHLVPIALEEGHGYLGEKLELPKVPMSLDPGKVGETGYSSSRLVSYIVKEIREQDHLLESSSLSQTFSPVSDLVKAERLPDIVANLPAKRLVKMSVVVQDEGSLALDISNSDITSLPFIVPDEQKAS